jgi:hypothetical protein
LGILLAGGALQFSWPTSAVGFALQEAAWLGRGWTNSTAGVQVQGVDNVAIVSAGDGARFFRLVQ